MVSLEDGVGGEVSKRHPGEPRGKPTIRGGVLLCQIFKKVKKKEKIVNLADFIFIESFSFIPKKKSRFDRFYIHSIILIYSAAH